MVHKSSPNPVDIHVGRRVRLRRTLLGMSQEKLGEMLGVTFQQVQKYERGANRIGSSRLYEIGQVLHVPVSFFFDDLDRPATPPAETASPGLAETTQRFSYDMPIESLLYKKETLELVRAYHLISDEEMRRRILDLTKALGKMPTTTAQ